MRTVGLIRVDIVFDTAGGVTAPEIDSATDLPLRRGRDEQPWVPPTSLAGSLRAHFGDRAEQFFGSAPPVGKGSQTELQPSPVRFLGTTTTLPAETGVEIRRSTAIDPYRGAAAQSTLRARELLPAGTSVALFLRYDERHDDLAPAYDLDGFLDTVVTWRPWIGRGRSTGNGQARVTRVAAHRLDLRNPTELLTWLRGDRFPAGDEGWERVLHGTTARTDTVLALDFATTDVLHIGAGSPATAGTPAPVARSAGAPVIPGSTWKGVLRSRCGYILRSCGIPACTVPAGQVPASLTGTAPAPGACGDCLLCRVFGYTGDSEGVAGQAVGSAGLLAFHDSRLDGADRRRNHIGIDRFTGGVRTGLLFSDEVVTEATFTLTITSTAPISPAVRGLLLLAIRDLHDGLVGLGRATTRGYGTVHLTDPSALDELHPDHAVGAAVRALLTGKSVA